jgi:hypothetical protein
MSKLREVISNLKKQRIEKNAIKKEAIRKEVEDRAAEAKYWEEQPVEVRMLKEILDSINRIEGRIDEMEWELNLLKFSKFQND